MITSQEKNMALGIGVRIVGFNDDCMRKCYPFTLENLDDLNMFLSMIDCESLNENLNNEHSYIAFLSLLKFSFRIDDDKEFEKLLDAIDEENFSEVIKDIKKVNGIVDSKGEIDLGASKSSMDWAVAVSSIMAYTSMPFNQIKDLTLPAFKSLLGDGSQFGISLQYKVQPSPDGLAQAFIIGEEFIGDDSACLVLGDNIFHGNGFSSMLKDAVKDAEENGKATVFGYWVSDPERYGVAEFDEDGNCLSIEEKPLKPKSNYAVVGLYFYPNKVVKVAKSIKPSARGELEITTVNQEFLQDGELKVKTLGRGFAWLDTGTHDSLSEASTFIEVIEKRQGLKIACLEGIAFRQGWITPDKMRELAQPMIKNQYGQYLLRVIDEVAQTGKPNLE